MPTMASRTVPAAAEMIARYTSECSTGPIHGSSVTCSLSPQSSGRNATRVIRDRMNATPSPSTMRAKRIVSSCTRWAAPSMWRTWCQ